VVPLFGETSPLGLLGVFRPVGSGKFPPEVVAAFETRAGQFGLGLDRCFRFHVMDHELKALRFKERVRDLLLDNRPARAERWSRLLSFLLESIPADYAHYYGLSDDGQRLSLTGVAGETDGFEGWVSMPVGRGMIGSAVGRDRVIVYSSDDDAVDKSVFLLPIRAREKDRDEPVGVILLDGAANVSVDGEDTAGRLQAFADIVAPLLSVRNPTPA
jgi:hypothetical protein